MRDVASQLADYFDATVERITPEDVLAGNEVRYPSPQLYPAPRHQLRPAWVAATAFMTTIVVIGGSLGVMVFLRARLVPAGSGSSPIAVPTDAGTDAGWSWLMVTVLVVVLVGAVIVQLTRRKRSRIERNGGSEMTMTTDKPQVDDDQKLHRTNRVLIVAVIVLALLAIGLGGWAIYQATTADEITAVPEDVAALLDKWESANNLNDGSVADLYAIGGYHQAGTNRYTGEDLATELNLPGMTHEWTTEPYLIVDEGDGRYVVARGLELGNGTTISSNSAFVFEITTDSDGQLEILQTNWIWQN